MRPEEPAADADTPRDALLEAAFAQFVQQAQAPPAFAARVRARAEILREEERPRTWRRRVAAWLMGAKEPWDGPEADRQAAAWWVRPPPGRRWTVGLATCLVLSLLGNVWLGVQRAGKDQGADPTAEAPPSPSEPAPGQYGRVRLAFADDVREQDLRTLLLSLQATILAGPSPQGGGTPGTPNTPEPMRLLLEELRAHPAVRLAEPVASP
jgi:hypothetical protein